MAGGFRLDVYLHNDSIDAKLDRLAQAVGVIMEYVRKLEDLVMTKAQDITASVDALSAALKEATDELARDLDRLRQEIRDGIQGGISATDANALQQKIDTDLGQITARLVELGKDPANPVPEP